MKIAEFASKMALAEGKKKEIGIGQVREMLRLINIATNGALYQLIKAMK